MTLKSESSLWVVGWAALAIGIIGLLGLVSIILFFTVGQPFGTLNDICIGLAAVMSGLVAWMFFPSHRTVEPVLSLLAIVLAVAGVLVVVTGSVLVISGITGWFLAGLYMAAGYALIGLWLLILVFSASHGHFWPARLIMLGLISGAVMLLGLVTIPGVLSGIDSQLSASWVINNIGMAGGLGWLVLYPAWCILLGRELLVGIPV